MDCEICGEPIRLDPAFPPEDRMWAHDEEVGEFFDEGTDRSLLAHAECGLAAGYEIA